MNKENLKKIAEMYEKKIEMLNRESACSVRVMASMGAKLDKQLNEIEQIEKFLNEVCDQLEQIQK